MLLLRQIPLAQVLSKFYHLPHHYLLLHCLTLQPFFPVPSTVLPPIILQVPTPISLQQPVPDLPVLNLLPISTSTPIPPVASLDSIVKLDDSNLVPGKFSTHTRIPNHQFYVSTRLSKANIEKPISKNSSTVSGPKKGVTFLLP